MNLVYYLSKYLCLIIVVVWTNSAYSDVATRKFGEKYICLDKGKYYFHENKLTIDDQSDFDIESETSSMQYIFEQNDELIARVSKLIGNQVWAPRFSYEVSNFPNSVDLSQHYERRSDLLQNITDKKGKYRYFKTVVLSESIVALQSTTPASKWHLFEKNSQYGISAVNRWRGSCLYMHEKDSSRCTYTTIYQDRYMLRVQFPGQAVLYGKSITDYVSELLDTEILLDSEEFCGSSI